MPKIPLELDNRQPQTRGAVVALNDHLPDHVYAHATATDAWVSYPEWYGEAKARDAVGKALSESGAQGVTLVDS